MIEFSINHLIRSYKLIVDNLISIEETDQYGFDVALGLTGFFFGQVEDESNFITYDNLRKQI